jgi:hypothetical protein
MSREQIHSHLLGAEEFISGRVPSNGHALKLPAPKCTSQYVWSMTWSWRAPGAQCHARRERRSASSAG